MDLALAPEHLRGHEALYSGLNQGRIEVSRLRRALTGTPLPGTADGRIVLAADVSPWLWLDANACSDRSFLPYLWRGRGQAPDGPGLAVLDRGGTGDRPHVVDRGAGRSPPAARCQCCCGDYGPGS
ncbi:transposase, partial [Nocardiopsis gilva]